MKNCIIILSLSLILPLTAADSAPQPQKVMRPTSLPNTVDYVETPSRDLPKTKAFFTALLGWRFRS